MICWNLVSHYDFVLLKLKTMSRKIKIIADDKIPFLRGVLEPYADILYMPGMKISHEHVKDADALLVRTRTNCDARLLDNTKVKFIGTATIGYDHIDTEYCGSRNIKWSRAPGCNSSSVMQYMASLLSLLAGRKKYGLEGKTIGIVGVGNVGRKIEELSEILGMKVLLNDPPRARKEGAGKFVSLEEITDRSDIITFHVPLNNTGIDKTFHMADENFFSRIKKGTIIINTSRGPVIETNSLIDAVKTGTASAAALDVWENEPDIDKELLRLTDIATPHIAGYSVDGKAKGTAMTVNALNEFFDLGIKPNWYPEKVFEPYKSREFEIDCSGRSKQQNLNEAIKYTYDIYEDDYRLRNSPATFEKQRGDYPVRREFTFYKLKLIGADPDTEQALFRLGFII